MTKLKVACIIGSLRLESHNLKLAKAIAKLGENMFTTNFLQIGNLPLYNQDLETEFPTEVLTLKKEIEAADAILFVTPEYNRGMPAPLKNALDWASRPYGKNSFNTKPAALCGASVGAIGTACAQNNLKPTLIYLGVVLMGQPELYLHFKDGLIDSEGNISNADTAKFLQVFTESFAAWALKHKI